MSSGDDSAGPDAAASGDAASDDPPAEIRGTVPEWDDEYLDRVSDRLMYNYDLERDYRAGGRRFDMYGEFRVRLQKHLLHPALNYANHDAEEHLFVSRRDGLRLDDVERIVEFGRDLADEWIDASEEHFSTDFTFVFVTDEIAADVAEFVEGFSGRTLIKYGYHGHYEINLVVVAPESEAHVASPNADVAQAFVLWEDIDPPKEGLFSRLARRIWERAAR